MRSRKNSKKNILFSFLIIFITLILIFYFFFYGHKSPYIKMFFRKAIAPKKIIYTIDKIYCNKEKSNIETFVKQSIDSGMFNFDTTIFYKELKKRSKLIKKIEWDFSSPEYAKLSIHAVIPRYLINGKFILGNKKRLFDKKMFEDFDESKLISFNVSNEFLGEKLNIKVYYFLNTMHPTFFDKFKITYFNPSYIEMLSTCCDDQYLIKAAENVFRDVKKFDFVDSIHNNLKMESKNYQINGRNKIYSFDLRFGDRIYVRSLSRKMLKDKSLGGG